MIKLPDPLQLLRPADVTDLLQIHRTTLWRWVAEGRFPKPIRISSGTVAWRRATVEAWLDDAENEATGP